MSEASAPGHVVVGTAGHIDHGKSTLVRALTGTDPDRLPEEKQRGITIDLGFAHLEAEGIALSFVDVPGHERFVHNMLAGATGIDVLMLVVAADESVMPQTREHLGICRLLGLRTGLVALTRIDLAGPELTDVAEDEVRDLCRGTFLENAPIVRVSGTTGEGLDSLRGALVAQARAVPPRASGPWPRLPVDRVFASRGFGTVVTGTLAGGALRTGDVLCVIPGGGAARVRGLQVHGAAVGEAGPHRRVAVNLQGVDRADIARGQVLAPHDRAITTLVFDAAVDVLGDAPAALAHDQRVRLHHGTAEIMARLRLPLPGTIAPGARGVCQLRLEAPLAALPGDRFVLRRFSPVTTLAGGTIVDLDPPRWRRADPAWTEQAAALAAADEAGRLLHAARRRGPSGLALAAAPRLGLAPEVARSAALSLSTGRNAALVLLAGEVLLAREAEAQLAKRLRQELSRHHRERPLEPGLAPERLRAALAPGISPDAFRALLDRFAGDGGIVVRPDAVRLSSHRTDPEGPEKERYDRMRAVLEASGLQSLGEDEWLAAAGADPAGRPLLAFALRRGDALRLSDGSFVSGTAFASLCDRLRAESAAGRATFDVTAFKDLFGLTRKYAIPLLEKLDDLGITQRVGNQRRIRG